MNVYQRLNAARKKFHELKLTKTGENTFAKYKYFELGDFLIPGLQVFEEVGLCATVSFPNGMATMTVRNVEKPDEVIVFESPMGSAALKGCHEVQNIGAVETYQRRYLWVAALEIVEHDALDATTGRDEPAKTAPQRKENGRLEGVGVHKPSAGMFEKLDEDQQRYILLLASVLPKMFEQQGVEAVCNRLERDKLENDMFVALWDQLGAHSKLRNAVKAEQEKRRVAQKETA
jgi:hypothetical protein